MPALFQFFGRLHPLILHAPIGLLTALVVLELIAIKRRLPLAPHTRAVLAWVAALSAALAAGTGFVLHLEGGYSESVVDLHEWLGIGVAAGAVLAAVALQAGYGGLFRVLLFATAAAIVPAGHFGATLTHGAGFLTEPFDAARGAAAGPGAPAIQPVSAPAYGAQIAPLLARYCADCHGSGRRKAGLSLHTPEAISKGSRRGPVIAPGDVARSKLVARLRLPLDDEDHMPPSDEPQPAPEEVRLIEEWIAGGARFDSAPAAPGVARAATPPAAGAPPERVSPATPDAAPGEPPAAESAAVNALADRLIHVEPVRRGSHLLVIDTAAVARQLTDEELRRLLEPLRPQIADLSIARTRATDGLMRLIAQMPNLRRLNAAATPLTDAGLAALAGHPRLETLIVSQTAVTDGAAETLASLPALKRVYVWKTAITPEGLASLRERVVVDTGDTATTKPLEAETTLAFTNDAAAPTAPAGGAAGAIKPINTECPVSGKPLDADYAVIYKGRVIGFCCQHCAAEFLENPEKFAEKLPR